MKQPQARNRNLQCDSGDLRKQTPDNFHQIWIMRDQIAYWEGKSEGLQFALKEFNKGNL